MNPTMSEMSTKTETSYPPLEWLKALEGAFSDAGCLDEWSIGAVSDDPALREQYPDSPGIAVWDGTTQGCWIVWIREKGKVEVVFDQ